MEAVGRPRPDNLAEAGQRVDSARQNDHYIGLIHVMDDYVV